MEVKGLSKNNIITISNYKGEDDWVREYRLKAFEQFENMSVNFHLDQTLNLILIK